jgi:2-polyprenyl-6-methoxyphenol hydroxylase-like FAD-dependent oxidoreductase
VANITIVGGGLLGLGTGLLLSERGHEVTVLERDRDEPGRTTDENWSTWKRQGVNQFRLPHFFLPPFIRALRAELPAVAEALTATGAFEYNALLALPEQYRGPAIEGDNAFELVTGRRPIVESAVAFVAQDWPRLTVRRGTVVVGLSTGAPVRDGVPHVVGVVTSSGQHLPSDLVIDMSGRRSALPQWLEAIGARLPTEEVDDCGFIYYARHFRSQDGSLPTVLGPLVLHVGTLTSLTLPADNGTWSVTLVASARDKAFYDLRHPATWDRAISALPTVVHWRDGEPIDDVVATIAKLEDRSRNFFPEGSPVATGVVAVGDAWACSNPTLGRGASIGMMHALALRDVLDSEGLDDHWAFVNAFWQATAERVEPWYRDALATDRDRMAEVDAGINGIEYRPSSRFQTWRALAAAGSDPGCLRGFLAVSCVLERQDEVLSRPGLLDKALAHGGDWRDRPLAGPTRDQLLSIVAG